MTAGGAGGRLRPGLAHTSAHQADKGPVRNTASTVVKEP
jgi:hypothetical protein